MQADEGSATVVDAFVFSIRADTRTRLIAISLDALTVLLPLGVAVLTVGAGAPGIAALCVLVAAGALAATVASLARTGRSAGSLLTRIRTVERSTATPSGRRLLSDLIAGSLVSCDLRRGRDPLAPAIGGFRFPERAAAQRLRARTVRTAIALLDSGQRIPFARSLLIGRNPASSVRSDQCFSWPDLSRTLAKTHARLSWDGEHVWVSDLGSAHGSVIQTGAERLRLEPFVAVRMPAHAVLWLGERSLTIAGSRRAARAAASEEGDTHA
jgi:hypothetical protein